MTSSKSTNRALLTSVLALLMCVTMLVGATFAWFTDTASTAVNKIQSGKLDVALEMQKADGSWESAEGKTLTFKTKDNRAADQILWEPGCTYELPQLRVVNKGNLALKYKIQITGIQGDAKLNEVIDWTINDAAINLTEVNLPAGQTCDAFTIKGHMQETAGNEYQGLTIDGIGITVFATQDTVENDSFGKTYDEGATYGTGATIIGLDGTYDSLTAAAKAWRESKGIATSGGNMGGHPADLTSVDSISWVISGSVGTGDGTGVVGTSGSLLSGGYIYPSIAINNVYIRGVNNAELKNELGSDYALTAGGKNVVYDGITFPEYVSFNFGAENVTFKNCTFKGGLKVMQAINVTVVNCKFEGDGSKDFAFFAQSVPADSMEAVQFKNNTVSSFMRGINVQAGTSATVSITGNTITNLTGYTKNDQTYGAAIQLTTGREFIITNNKIDVNTGNAFRFYSGLDADVTISDNIIKAPYLVWNQAELPNEKITSQDNKLTITNPNKAATSDGALEDATVIKAAPTQIIIYVPTDDTPTTTGNPTTGANDFVGIAAAAAVVALLGSAVILRKK